MAARTATAADFDRAAQRHANAFWLWAIAAGALAYFLGWWALIPAALAVWSAVSSIGCTRAAGQLRGGSYRIPNPNNGAPDGDARHRRSLFKT